jgi:hypothetical protein
MSTGGIIWKLEGSEILNKKYKIITVVAIGILLLLTYGVWQNRRSTPKKMSYTEFLQEIQKSDVIEFWHVWLMDYYEFEDRPFIHRKAISVYELTTEHIKEIDHAVIWNTPDKMYPERPSFYCLTITR